MPRLLNALREHRLFFIVVTLLTLATTFPAIVYIFKTDVFWLPTRNGDVYIHIWDAWYGKQVLTGQADRLYTNLMFYPEGLPLSSHQYALPNIVAVMVFNLFLPLSNAFSLAWLLLIFSCALSGYVYLLWLFEDKWIALLGAVVFGFSPHVVGEPHHPAITFVAPIPLVLYCFHRGVREQRAILVILAGVLTGLTSIGLLYTYVIVLIMLGLYVCAFAVSRWRDRRYWQYIALLILVVAASSFWGVYPLISDSEVTDAALAWYTGTQHGTDAISFFVNHRHPLFGNPLGAILQTPAKASTSPTSFLGYLPLLLIGFGLCKRFTRRKMLPWALLCGIFLILRLGPYLNINGVAYPDILLPKFYLDQIPPGVFKAFWVTDQFMAGAILPLAILTGYGLIALQRRDPRATKPLAVLALVIIVAFEYHVPIREQIIPQEQFDFLDWLRSEEEQDEIRLINIPIHFHHSKTYNLYQVISGLPHAEGAISRTPDSAYDYISANYMLSAWRNNRPVDCNMPGRENYLSALAQLDEDGFSHVVFHLRFGDFHTVNESLAGVRSSYADKYVLIARLSDLRESCPQELSASHLFTDTYAATLNEPLIIDERHGTVVVFPPTMPANDHFMRYLRHFSRINRDVMTITSDEQANVTIQGPAQDDIDSAIELERSAALWLINGPQEFDAEQTPAYQDWFKERFHFCQRFFEDEGAAIDLYVAAKIPCSAMDESSEMEVQYDVKLRLHNISYVADRALLRFFLAWTNTSTDNYAYSLQFFDEAGQKALQYDHVIYRDLLAVRDIDASSLTAGVYSIQLIVYDFETQVSQGGTIIASGQRFDRELEIARIEL